MDKAKILKIVGIVVGILFTLFIFRIILGAGSSDKAEAPDENKVKIEKEQKAKKEQALKGEAAAHRFAINDFEANYEIYEGVIVISDMKDKGFSEGFDYKGDNHFQYVLKVKEKWNKNLKKSEKSNETLKLTTVGVAEDALSNVENGKLVSVVKYPNNINNPFANKGTEVFIYPGAGVDEVLQDSLATYTVRKNGDARAVQKDIETFIKQSKDAHVTKYGSVEK